MNQSNPIKICFKGFIEAWEQRKLGDAINIGSGRDYKHLGEGNIPVYGTGGYLTSVDQALSSEKDAVGIGRKGTINSPYILKAPFWTVDTLFFCLPKPGVDLNFLFCLFQRVDWKKKDESTGVPSLSKRTIENTEIPFCSIEEQRKIGTFFDSLEKTITLHQSKLSKFQMLEATLLLKMFPKHGGTKPEIRFASFNNEWRLHKFEDLFSEYVIKGFDQYSALSVVQGAGTIERDRSNRNLSYSTKNLGNYKVVYKDDFILHLRSFEGGLEWANSTGLVSPAYHVFHSRKVNSSFIYRIFRSSNFINRLLSPCVYGIRDGKSVDVSELKKVLLTVPDISEQRKLGYLFDLIDKVISLHQRKADLLKQIKSSLLQSMFPPSNAE